MKQIVLLFLCSSLSLHLTAQSTYSKTDAYVEELGALNGLNVATIADTLSQVSSDKEQQARAIYYWISHNISLDLKGTKGNDNKNIDPVKVVETRKATPLGYSTLFQEMCSQAGIRCLTVDGYIKFSSEEINNPSDEINHSWNVVQLGSSPTEWFYADACKGAGFTDKQFKTFTPQFTSEYFFADKALFNLDHYPDNIAWQLNGGPKSIKDFYTLPLIGNAAYPLGLKYAKPNTGYIKTKMKNPVAFNFKINGELEVKSIILLIGDEKKAQKKEDMNFSNKSGEIAFSYQFKKDDVFPVKIIVDGKTILEYMIEVAE